MARIITSFEDRITRVIVQELEIIGIAHSKEEDFNSVSSKMSAILNEPAFNMKLQILPEIVRLKVHVIRPTLTIAIYRDAGDSPYEQGLKLTMACDKIIKWIQTTAGRTLNARRVRVINKDVQITGELYRILLQFEFIAFLISGEY